MQPAKHLNTIKPSYIREILNLTADSSIISLAGGLPCSELFPMDLIDEIMPIVNQTPQAYQYTPTAGLPDLIDFIRARYQVPNNQEILITHGSQQGIDLCARLFIEHGDGIAVESPSYLGALQAFTIAQATIHSVQQEHDGPNIEELTKCFQSNKIKFFYAVPDFHNPTGCCWSLEKRKRVAALCQQFNILLLEDAPYRELRFRGKSMPMVSQFCPDHAITLHSFSKTVIPGVRLAALITPKTFAPLLIKLKQATDLHSNTPMQILVYHLMKHKQFIGHQETLRQVYSERYKALAENLLTLNKWGCQFSPVDGGMFIWLTLPNCNSFELAKCAINNGVAVVPSTEFYADVNISLPALRLNFSYNKPAMLKEGVKKLEHTFNVFS